MKLARTKEWRESHGLTQRELASEASVGEATVARIETGASVSPPTARKIAEALDVAVADLLERPPVPLAEAPRETGQEEAEERDTPGVAFDVLSHYVKFTTQLADVLETEVDGVERDRTFPYFAWDYRTEATISHLTEHLGENGILAYVAEVREGHRLAQNEERRLAAALASNLSRLRHLAERAHVIAQILHVDSYVEGRHGTTRPVPEILEEWEKTSAPDVAAQE